ncbi:MAG: hypothetical protein OXU62_02045 [Gammaproteobacteria bacterium]|nr:hypothetical protein [Gammaproteobacteria bacterium]
MAIWWWRSRLGAIITVATVILRRAVTVIPRWAATVIPRQAATVIPRQAKTVAAAATVTR